MLSAGLGDLLDSTLGLLVVGLVDDVRLGNDPDERAAVVDDRNPAYLLAAHEAHHRIDVVIRFDRSHALAHRLAHLAVGGAVPLGDVTDRDVAVGDDADELPRA